MHKKIGLQQNKSITGLTLRDIYLTQELAIKELIQGVEQVMCQITILPKTLARILERNLKGYSKGMNNVE